MRPSRSSHLQERLALQAREEEAREVLEDVRRKLADAQRQTIKFVESDALQKVELTKVGHWVAGPRCVPQWWSRLERWLPV